VTDCSGAYASPSSPHLLGEHLHSDAIRHGALVKQRGRQFLTALQLQDNRFKLLSWRVLADGAPVPVEESSQQVEPVTRVSIARGQKFVTACGTEAGPLRLWSWDVSLTGAIRLAGWSEAQSDDDGAGIDAVQVAALSPHVFVTVSLGTAGDMRLRTWRLRADGALVRLGDNNAVRMRAQQCHFVRAPSAHLGESALITSTIFDGRAQLALWLIKRTGDIEHVHTSDPLPFATHEFYALPTQQNLTLAAARAQNGHLYFVRWNRSEPTPEIRAAADNQLAGEPLDEMAVTVGPRGRVAALCLAAGALSLRTWRLGADGTLHAAGESTRHPRAVNSLAICPEMLTGAAPILTAARTAGRSQLQLLTWGWRGMRDA